jgi:hypothetical protein
LAAVDRGSSTRRRAERRIARSRAIEAEAEQAERCVMELSSVSAEFQAIEVKPSGADNCEGPQPC